MIVSVLLLFFLIELDSSILLFPFSLRFGRKTDNLLEKTPFFFVHVPVEGTSQ